jgi:hypothetical protein
MPKKLNAPKPLPSVPVRHLTIDGPYRSRSPLPKVWPVALVAVIVSALMTAHLFAGYRS